MLERITPKMDILENASYHRRLLMYKGLEKPEALLDTANADDTHDRDAGLRRRQLLLRHRRYGEGAARCSRRSRRAAAGMRSATSPPRPISQRMK